MRVGIIDKSDNGYLTSGHEKIPADELPRHMYLVPEDKLFAGGGREVPMDVVMRQFEKNQPNSEKLLATARVAVREQWEKEQDVPGKETMTPKNPAKAKDVEPER